mmetsp:Transcript_10815/g.11818  ORF Transcript_10815/g.11818 Transcript_10815/m.11818 type:complete len:109 (+) Transcript_10815:426-752(+)
MKCYLVCLTICILVLTTEVTALKHQSFRNFRHAALQKQDVSVTKKFSQQKKSETALFTSVPIAEASKWHLASITSRTPYDAKAVDDQVDNGVNRPDSGICKVKQELTS